MNIVRKRPRPAFAFASFDPSGLPPQSDRSWMFFVCPNHEELWAPKLSELLDYLSGPAVLSLDHLPMALGRSQLHRAEQIPKQNAWMPMIGILWAILGYSWWEHQQHCRADRRLMLVFGATTVDLET